VGVDESPPAPPPAKRAGGRRPGAPHKRRRIPPGGHGGPARTPAQLEELLAYRFKDQSLLHAALKHGSAAGRHRAGGGRAGVSQHQRLEFLGDRVLGLVIARLLLEAYPGSAEGALTNRSQVLVSTGALAEIAAEFGLSEFLELDAGARAQQISRKMAADACEALIGALFLDGGLVQASAFIERFWAKRIAGMATPPRDPKMALQEWALMRGQPLPIYEIVTSEGPPHAPVFRVQVTVEGHLPVAGQGSTKRRAEQAAARTLLERIGDRHGA
jgi:ribonuclease-3